MQGKRDIRIKLNDQFELVAEKYDSGMDTDKGESFYEMSVYLYDTKNECIHQDICIIRQPYEFEENGDNIKTKDGVECLIYSDKNNEDYTHKFNIDIYEQEKELEEDTER